MRLSDAGKVCLALRLLTLSLIRTGPPHFLPLIQMRTAASMFLFLAVASPAVVYAQASPAASPTPAVSPTPTPAVPVTAASPAAPNAADARPLLAPRQPPPSIATRHPNRSYLEGIYPKRGNLLHSVETDLRFRSSYGNESNGTYIAAARLTGDYVRADRQNGQEKGGVRAQVVYEAKSSRGISDHALRFSELYGFYRFRFPGVSANVRFGQFVIPFGLAAAYDSSMLPVHSLYDKSLGLRVDIGAMLEGEYGPYHYAGSITDGSGPDRRDFNNGRIIAFRLDRAINTQYGRIEVGGSILSGRGPVTNFQTELPPSGFSGARQFKDITRFAGDGQYHFRAVTARGEVVFGADDQKALWGYFGEGEYRFLPSTSVIIYNRTWNFPVHPQQYASSGLGIRYAWRPSVLLNALYEYERDAPLPTGTPPIVIRRFTVQTRLAF